MRMNREFTTPIASGLKRIYRNEGDIYYTYTKKVLFKVARITYELFEDESFQYIFVPYWDVIDGLEGHDWGGIPGIDLSLRQDAYYRVGMTPVFISERTPPPNRVNLAEELREVNLEYLNRLEWLKRTHTIYFGDQLVVEDCSYNAFTGISSQSAQWHALSILQLLGMRLPIEIDGRSFEESERTLLIRIFLMEYEFLASRRLQRQKAGQEEARLRGIYKGRPPLQVSLLLLAEIKDKIDSGHMSIEEAMKKTGLSRSTLYRRLKNLKTSQI